MLLGTSCSEPHHPFVHHGSEYAGSDCSTGQPAQHELLSQGMLLLQVGTSALSCSVPAKLSADVPDLPAAGANRQASCHLAQTGGVPALRSTSHSFLPSAAAGQAYRCTA